MELFNPRALISSTVEHKQCHPIHDVDSVESLNIHSTVQVSDTFV